jgi:hypothetical protein
MQARIHLRDDLLIAKFEDGKEIQHTDAKELARLLWANGIDASQVSITDWHEDALGAPTGGQKVAIFSTLRALENSAIDSP